MADWSVTVEPAGAATLAAWRSGRLAEPLAGLVNVALVVSGGNPAPDQLAAIRGGRA